MPCICLVWRKASRLSGAGSELPLSTLYLLNSQSGVQAVGKDTIKDLKAPEEILKGLGANYSKASADWGPHVEIDSSGSGPLVTGQSQFMQTCKK